MFFHLRQYIAMGEEKTIEAYCLKSQAILEPLAGLLSDDSMLQSLKVPATLEALNEPNTGFMWFLASHE